MGRIHLVLPLVTLSVFSAEGQWALPVEHTAELPPGAYDMTCTEIIPEGTDIIYFRSPGNYPHNYDNNVDTCWLIRSTHVRRRPRLRVTSSAIEALFGAPCFQADFVQVNDGSTLNDTVLMQWCGWGYPTRPFIASGKTLLVYFHSDNSINFGGFEMKAYINESAQRVLAAAQAEAEQAAALAAIEAAAAVAPPSDQGGNNQPQNTPVNTGTESPDNSTESSQMVFNNNIQSRNLFDNRLKNQLEEAWQSNGKNLGIIVGSVLAVLLGIPLIGVAIHFATKWFLKKSKRLKNQTDDIIIPRRICVEEFDSLDNVMAREEAKGNNKGSKKRGKKKYSLPAHLRPTVLPPDKIDIKITDEAARKSEVVTPMTTLGSLTMSMEPVGDKEGHLAFGPTESATLGVNSAKSSHFTKLDKRLDSNIQKYPQDNPLKSSKVEKDQGLLVSSKRRNMNSESDLHIRGYNAKGTFPSTSPRIAGLQNGRQGDTDAKDETSSSCRTSSVELLATSQMPRTQLTTTMSSIPVDLTEAMGDIDEGVVGAPETAGFFYRDFASISNLPIHGLRLPPLKHTGSLPNLGIKETGRSGALSLPPLPHLYSASDSMC